ncbi:hypothetical protein D9M70_428150 [compost metagenome]
MFSGEEPVTYAEGLEVDDIVEVSRPELAEIIKHNDDSGSISAAKAVPGTGRGLRLGWRTRQRQARNEEVGGKWRAG